VGEAEQPFYEYADGAAGDHQAIIGLPNEGQLMGLAATIGRLQNSVYSLGRHIHRRLRIHQTLGDALYGRENNVADSSLLEGHWLAESSSRPRRGA
jgi:hypothetical protein